jgi:MoxR-like ATPase
MTSTPEFRQYRGDGTTRDGRPALTSGERGRYLAPPDLVSAVNAALAVEQPLLVTGKAGTGKTMLAFSIAAELELEIEVFTVRSDQQGRDLLYELDNLQRFYDAQANDPRARERGNYLRLGSLGQAFRSETRKVVLIDEIDKAPRDFPNDLLYALDRMELHIPELDIQEPARHRPVVVITSNRESQLPDPFLRRCVFHHIERPDKDRLLEILEERLGHLELTRTLTERIVRRFDELRDVPRLLKEPTTSEMLTWARILHRAGVTEGDLAGELRDLPYLGALLKTQEDLSRVRPPAA